MADTKHSRVAIVGGESLIGREIRELLSNLTPKPELRTISGEAESAQITRDEEGEPTILEPMTPETLTGVEAVFLTGTPESSVRAAELVSGRGVPLIDLTGALEDHPEARLRAPILETAAQSKKTSIQLIAHPAALSLALFYGRLASRWPIARSVVDVFEPASERGQKGLRELQVQTVNLLSFKPLPKDVFDAQLGFGMLAAYGSEAPHPLEESELRIDRHLASLLSVSSRPPMPSLRLVQAPVFHGYSCSVWMEFESSPPVEEIEGALASAQIEVRTAGEEPPNNVGVAGQSGVSVGAIRNDRNNPRAYWFWLVADNLRTFAETAVSVLKEYL